MFDQVYYLVCGSFQLLKNLDDKKMIELSRSSQISFHLRMVWVSLFMILVSPGCFYLYEDVNVQFYLLIETIIKAFCSYNLLKLASPHVVKDMIVVLFGKMRSLGHTHDVQVVYKDSCYGLAFFLFCSSFLFVFGYHIRNGLYNMIFY